MTISLRLNENDGQLIKAFADLHGMTVSELFRQSVLEKIEDELDLKAGREALAEFEANPKTYTPDEVAKELAL